MNIQLNKIFFLLGCLVIVSCTEPYPLETESNFEGLLVIEAQISNKLKFQKIKISSTYGFEEDGPSPITDAVVKVKDDTGLVYTFNYYPVDSSYISTEMFQAFPEREYQLFINHSGEEYASSAVSLPKHTEIGEISVETTTKDGVEGLQVSVSSYDPTGSSVYYRYDFTETYKVKAPYYSNKEAGALNNGWIHWWEPSENYKEVCFVNKKSDKILQFSTNDLFEDRVENFPIRFISKDDGILEHRYSIEITQYVQNYEAYIYYSTLANVSLGGDVLSPTQPGFINGNIISENSPERKIIGFFEVVSESSERKFIKFNDYYLGESPKLLECEVYSYNSEDLAMHPPGEAFELRNHILNNTLILYDVEFPDYIMVPPSCGDCKTLGSPEIPDFWEE
ncbi:MAG TPA: DUF4249 domain-containing protein [Salinimicrobium sp.]|nr:DUF4249 domain-containing protein [Salinimicrobium sp.]